MRKSMTLLLAGVVALSPGAMMAKPGGGHGAINGMGRRMIAAHCVNRYAHSVSSLINQ